jgi:AcrR family transcriptional regulator
VTGRGYAKGRAKRDEIVDVALDLFATMGYDRTSVREIARRTGLSQAGLLHHFRSKEELFLEVLRRRDVRNQRFYDSEQHEVSLPGLVEIVRHNAEEPGLVRLYVAMSAESTAPDSPVRQFFESRYELLLANIAVDVTKRKESGELPADLDEQAVASLLVAAADGLQIQWLLDPKGVDMGARLELLARLLRGSSAAARAGDSGQESS